MPCLLFFYLMNYKAAKEIHRIWRIFCLKKGCNFNLNKRIQIWVERKSFNTTNQQLEILEADKDTPNIELRTSLDRCR
jgi:hypothetical protein